MVKRCSWGTCNTDSRYPERLTGGIKFIPFPKPATNIEKCKRWIRLCGRTAYQLNEEVLRDRNKSKHFYVCSKHFIDGEPSEKVPDPISALPHNITTPSCPAPKLRHALKDITPKESEKKARMFWVSAENDQQKDIENEEETTTCDTQEMAEGCDTQEMAEGFHGTNSLEFLALVAENRKLEEKVFTLLNEKEDLIRKNRDLQEKAKSQSHMKCYNLKCNNKIDDFKYYTGFPSQVFNVVFEFLCPVDEPFQ